MLGEGATTLSVPGEIVDTLLAQSNDCKDFVRQLEDKLNLNDAALRDPNPDNKVLIRTLAKKANNAGRSDLVEELRKIVPARTTGKFWIWKLKGTLFSRPSHSAFEYVR